MRIPLPDSPKNFSAGADPSYRANVIAASITKESFMQTLVRDSIKDAKEMGVTRSQVVVEMLARLWATFPEKAARVAVDRRGNGLLSRRLLC